MFVLLAALIATACIAASARRVVLAQTATWLAPRALLEALRGDAGRAAFPRIAGAIADEPFADWERDLLAALRSPEVARTALVNEQLTELDYRVQRWARVPRVCASIASSGGFLLASLALRNALAATSDAIDVNGAVTSALNVAAIGIAGASFCIAAQYRARKIAKSQLTDADKLVERLERLIELRSDSDGRPSPAVSD